MAIWLIFANRIWAELRYVTSGRGSATEKRWHQVLQGHNILVWLLKSNLEDSHFDTQEQRPALLHKWEMNYYIEKYFRIHLLQYFSLISLILYRERRWWAITFGKIFGKECRQSCKSIKHLRELSSTYLQRREPGSDGPTFNFSFLTLCKWLRAPAREINKPIFTVWLSHLLVCFSPLPSLSFHMVKKWIMILNLHNYFEN